MPSGYTAKLYEGDQTFEEFVLGCARAFGALVTMREEPSTTPIPDRIEPDNHHERALERARKRIAELDAMTVEDARMEADAAYMGAVASHEERVADHRAKGARYAAMLRLVEAWEPPTADHVGLKEFMAEQLEESGKFDAYEVGSPPQRLTPSEWLEREFKSAHRDVGYHAAEQAKEVARAASRTAWGAGAARESERDTDGGGVMATDYLLWIVAFMMVALVCVIGGWWLVALVALLAATCLAVLGFSDGHQGGAK